VSRFVIDVIGQRPIVEQPVPALARVRVLASSRSTSHRDGIPGLGIITYAHSVVRRLPRDPDVCSAILAELSY
jgi:hypothetical protein